MMREFFKRRVTWLALLVVVAGLGVAGTLPMSVEEPKFSVAMRDGAFEIRDYAPTIAAEVSVTGDRQSAVRKGFRMLAGYIFGGNARKQSIAMTAPVAQAPRGETIAMTTPVSQTPAGGAWVVRFTMPAGLSLETLPKPTDPRVTLRPIAAKRFATLRFSGFVSDSAVSARTAELLAWVKTRHLRTVGAVTLAQYNPPWTLWFLRRNEVMIELAE